MSRTTARGFSLIELMATLAIMAALLLIVVPSARLVTQRHRESELRTALATIRGALDHYKKAVEQGRIPLKAGESGYPPSLSVLVAGVDDASSPRHEKIYFLRRLPADPMRPGKEGEPEESWGLRSYASPPDEPVQGEDVFDVYSTAPGVGLNGIAYRDW